MSSRSSRYTCFTRYPWMSVPRICPATARASSSESAGLIPPALQCDDGPDLRRGPADERLVRGPGVVQGEEPFLRLQAKLRDDLEDRLPGDPWEVRGGPRGDDRRVADDEEVLRGGLRHISVDVEHQGLVGAVLVRLDPGHDVVQVVQRL